MFSLEKTKSNSKIFLISPEFKTQEVLSSSKIVPKYFLKGVTRSKTSRLRWMKRPQPFTLEPWPGKIKQAKTTSEVEGTSCLFLLRSLSVALPSVAASKPQGDPGKRWGLPLTLPRLLPGGSSQFTALCPCCLLLFPCRNRTTNMALDARRPPMGPGHQTAGSESCLGPPEHSGGSHGATNQPRMSLHPRLPLPSGVGCARPQGVVRVPSVLRSPGADPLLPTQPSPRLKLCHLPVWGTPGGRGPRAQTLVLCPARFSSVPTLCPPKCMCHCLKVSSWRDDQVR